MKVLYIGASQIDPDINTHDWADELTSKRFKRFFLKKKPVVVATIEGIDIYCYKEMKSNGYHYYFASFENNIANNAIYSPITFYCHIGYNSTRNGLFKLGSGLHTILIWRDKFADLPSSFAGKVLNQVILKQFVNKLFISDKIKIPKGAKLSKQVMKILAIRGWQLYIGLSDGQNKYVIPVTYKQYINKIQTTQGFDKSHRYRCVFALKNEDELRSVLNGNQVQIVPFGVAIRTGLFTKPVSFNQLEQIDLQEYNDYED